MKLSFAHGVVCGMKYLHEKDPPVIHSDLKMQNILIDGNFVAKVSWLYCLLFHCKDCIIIFLLIVLADFVPEVAIQTVVSHYNL